jgi:Tubulin like
MSQLSQNERQSRTIKRTLCIGLGGTGRDVLMQIRRLIIDRYGKLSELPVVSFVHIDADKGASKVSGLRTGNTYHGEDILFRDAEKVVATMSSQEVNDLVQGLEKRSLYEREGPYDHIGSWFAPQLLRNIKAIEDGASGIRPVGRLAFFHNYRKIHETIKTAENRTIGHNRKLLEKGLIVEPGLNIFVVGSLCGGTGSGMFLDVAYSLRRAYGDKENQIIGYWVISPELYGTTPSMNANTYAALKELNYYASENTKFEARYDPYHLIDVSETRPPFDFVYLVSNQTAKDHKILEKAKLSNIIAHKIFLDFADELASVIQGQKNNFLERLAKNDQHPRPNVQRYLTFGLAKVYFPRDLTIQVSLNQIKLKLLSFWLNGEGQNPDTKALLERFLLNWRSDREGRDIFSFKLEEATQENNKTFNQTLNNWKNQLEQRILACQNQSDRKKIIQQIPGDFRSQFRKVQPGETETTRGIWLTNLQQVSSRITTKFQQDITQYLTELLNPANADFSLTATRSWLEALLTELNKYQRTLEEKIQNSNSLYRLENVEKKWQDAERILQDIEQKQGFFGMDRKKNSQFQDESIRILQDIHKLTKHNFDYVLNREALEIVKNLQQTIQSITTQASNLDNLLKTLQSSYDKRGDDLEHLNEDRMNGEAIFADADTNECYQNLLPNKERRSQLVAVGTKITEQLSSGESLIHFLTQDRLIDEKQLQEKIDEIVESLFGSRSLNVVQSVIKRFLQKYPFSDGETRLAQILQEAEPLLPLNLNTSYFFNEAGKTSKIIGFKDTDEREVKQFRELLTKNLGIPDNVIKPTQTEDEIVIVNEYAAFPLRLINGLGQMREQYNQQQKFESILLHNDYRKNFTDIIPPDARKMEELQDIFYSCLAFDLLKENSNTQKYEFQYYDELRHFHETVGLSYIWNEALEQLANLQEMTEALKELRDKAINDIKNQHSQWDNYYLPKLREFVRKVDVLPQDHPNFPEKAQVVGVKATIDTPEKKGIIERILRQIQEQVLNQSPLSLPSLDNENKRLEPSLKPNNEIVVELDEYLIQEDEIEIKQPSSNNLQELYRLEKMFEKGLLTKEQFEVLTKQLLGL